MIQVNNIITNKKIKDTLPIGIESILDANSGRISFKNQYTI